MLLYRLETDTGYQESPDVDVLKTFRASMGKTSEQWPIKEVQVSFTVMNDPELRVLGEYAEAEQVLTQLQDETFYIDTTKTFSDPQPEGLND